MTTRQQTAAFRTSPFMDRGEVQDTLHHPSPSITQACLFRLPDNLALLSCLLKEIAALQVKGAIAHVLRSQLHHAAFYGSMFFVPTPNMTYKPILNVSDLNVHVPCPHFKMETVQSVRAAVRPQEWTFSIDLQDAHLHVPMHPASYRYLLLVLLPTEIFSPQTLAV